MMPAATVFFNRSMNIMARFIITAVFIKMFVIGLMPIITVVAARVVVFAPLVKPLMIPMFFILVSAGLLPLVFLMDRFGVFGNGVMLLFGGFIAPFFFALRPCCCAKYKNACCRQDTDYH